MNFQDWLNKEHACSEASAFCGGKTLKQAWEEVTRPDWMIWLMLKVGYKDDQMYRLFSCWCAANTPLADGRVIWDLLTDNRSRKAILVAIDFANGEASHDELQAACAAAAAWADAWDAAWPAACAAAAAWADAWDTARDAACAAAAAGDDAAASARASARASAWDAAWDAAGDAQAKELRRRVDFKKLLRLAKKAGISNATR